MFLSVFLTTHFLYSYISNPIIIDKIEKNNSIELQIKDVKNKCFDFCQILNKSDEKTVFCKIGCFKSDHEQGYNCDWLKYIIDKDDMNENSYRKFCKKGNKFMIEKLFSKHYNIIWDKDIKPWTTNRLKNKQFDCKKKKFNKLLKKVNDSYSAIVINNNECIKFRYLDIEKDIIDNKNSFILLKNNKFEPPTIFPTFIPTSITSISTTYDPTIRPTILPTSNPSISPTNNPTINPTIKPTIKPTILPTSNPSVSPTYDLTYIPSVSPTNNPTRITTKRQ